MAHLSLLTWVFHDEILNSNLAQLSSHCAFHPEAEVIIGQGEPGLQTDFNLKAGEG